MPKANITSTIKLKALKLVEDCSKHRIPASELESALDLTASQRQRVLYSLKRDGLIDFIVAEGSYLIKYISPLASEICRNALTCQHFTADCKEGACCILPLFKEETCK